jgi:hypothetical protein
MTVLGAETETWIPLLHSNLMTQIEEKQRMDDIALEHAAITKKGLTTIHYSTLLCPTELGPTSAQGCDEPISK